MVRMLSANDASLISAGIGEPPHKQELQKLLDLIESEVRYAASAGRNKAPLLCEEFKGWDSANISELDDVMSWVFQILREEGYSFHTEQMLQIGNVASTCSQVPYPHTVVTWPEAQTELTLEERTEIADSLGKDLEYVDPVFAPPTMPPKGVFPGATLPAPGTPKQLIEYLRQKGYKMEGFGCLVEVKHKPTNWDTCRAIGTLVLKLLEAHRFGSPKAPTTAYMPLAEYPDVDFKYLRGTFAEVGLLVQQKGDIVECHWPVSAWKYFPIAPIFEGSTSTNINSITQLIDMLGVQGIPLELQKPLSEGLKQRLLFKDHLISRDCANRCYQELYDNYMVGNNCFQLRFPTEVVLEPVKEVFELLGCKCEVCLDNLTGKTWQLFTVSWVLSK